MGVCSERRSELGVLQCSYDKSYSGAHREPDAYTGTDPDAYQGTYQRAHFYAQYFSNCSQEYWCLWL